MVTKKVTLSNEDGLHARQAEIVCENSQQI